MQSTSPLRISSCSWQQQSPALQAIRQAVFIDEQQVPIALEWDEEDAQATHFLVYLDQQPVGCARLIIQDDALRNSASPSSNRPSASIGRMAILKPYRRQGLGAQLLQAVIEYAQQQTLSALYLHAQSHALDFYLAAGFRPQGEVFMEAGIPHQKMYRLVDAC